MSVSIDGVVEVLEREVPEFRGDGWRDMRFAGFGPPETHLFDVPHGYWRGTGPLPPDHSRRFLDEFRATVGSATRLVDVVALGLPAGSFVQALAAGLDEALHRPGAHHLDVRLIAGLAHGASIDLDAFMRDLAGRITAPTRRLRLYAVVHQYMTPDALRWHGNWNHAKFVAVDSKRVLTGGQNWTSIDSLEPEPVFDLTLRLDGEPANAAHRFANRMWASVRRGLSRVASRCYIDGQHGALDAPPETDEPEQASSVGNQRVLSLGQLGMEDWPTGPVKKSPGLEALYGAIGLASHDIRTSQQDLGGLWGVSLGGGVAYRSTTRSGQPVLAVRERGISAYVYYFDETLLLALARAMRRKVVVSVVLSNVGAISRGGGKYSNGPGPFHITFALGHVLMREIGMKREDVHLLLQQFFSLQYLRFRGADRWGADRPLIANHAKAWLFDRNVMVAGSLNAYPSIVVRATHEPSGLLQEWAVMLEGPDAIEPILDAYWNPIFDGQPVTLEYEHLPRPDELAPRNDEPGEPDEGPAADG